MRTLCRLAFKLFSGLSLGAISFNATAGISSPTDISVSWALQAGGSTPVPTLGAYGAGALAVLVAVLMYRAISNNPRLMGALIVAALSAGTVAGATWIAPSIAGGASNIDISSGAECNRDDFPLRDTTVATLTNNCAAPVTVTYEVLQASDCFAGGLAALECSPSEDECVNDGGSVPVGETRQFLGCYPSS